MKVIQNQTFFEFKCLNNNEKQSVLNPRNETFILKHFQQQKFVQEKKNFTFSIKASFFRIVLAHFICTLKFNKTKQK